MFIAYSVGIHFYMATVSLCFYYKQNFLHSIFNSCKFSIYSADVDLYNFRTRQCNGAETRDYVITSNPAADDLNHPVRTERIKYTSDSVDSESLAFYFKPNVG